MTEQMAGHHTGAGARLTDRAAGGLLLAFLATVIVVLAVATSMPTVVDDANTDQRPDQTAVSIQ